MPLDEPPAGTPWPHPPFGTAHSTDEDVASTVTDEGDKGGAADGLETDDRRQDLRHQLGAQRDHAAPARRIDADACPRRADAVAGHDVGRRRSATFTSQPISCTARLATTLARISGNARTRFSGSESTASLSRRCSWPRAKQKVNGLLRSCPWSLASSRRAEIDGDGG